MVGEGKEGDAVGPYAVDDVGVAEQQGERSQEARAPEVVLHVVELALASKKASLHGAGEPVGSADAVHQEPPRRDEEEGRKRRCRPHANGKQ